MKTVDDLKKLIPAIIDLISGIDHEIGECHIERDEDGWSACSDYAVNHVFYEEDGWLIEVVYQCCGEWEIEKGDYWNPQSYDLRKAWGEVTEITASHYDEETGEETEFKDKDLDELCSAIDEVLKDIA